MFLFQDPKKVYFKEKLVGVRKMIWDWEFKREKTRMIREEIRVEYDSLKSRLELLESQIKAQKDKPTMEKGDIARLDDQKVVMTRDMERYKEQMKNLDAEINGSTKTNDFPEGVQGISQTIDSLNELVVMISEYIKRT